MNKKRKRKKSWFLFHMLLPCSLSFTRGGALFIIFLLFSFANLTQDSGLAFVLPFR